MYYPFGCLSGEQMSGVIHALVPSCPVAANQDFVFFYLLGERHFVQVEHSGFPHMMIWGPDGSFPRYFRTVGDIIKRSLPRK